MLYGIFKRETENYYFLLVGFIRHSFSTIYFKEAFNTTRRTQTDELLRLDHEYSDLKNQLERIQRNLSAGLDEFQSQFHERRADDLRRISNHDHRLEILETTVLII